MFLNYSNVGKFLFEFESSKFEKLKDIQTRNWNTWRVVKTAVFFNTIHSASVYSNPINKKSINIPYKILFATIKCPGVTKCNVNKFINTLYINFHY